MVEIKRDTIKIDNSNDFVDQTDEQNGNFDNLDKIFVSDIINNDDIIEELATEILEKLEIESNDPAILDDVKTLIKIQAKNFHQDASITVFAEHIIQSLQDYAEDEELTEDELETGIIQSTKEVLESEKTQFTVGNDDGSLYEFLADTLLAISDGEDVIGSEYAPLLADLLGVDESLADEIIEATSGNINDILSLIGSSESLISDDTSIINENLTIEDIENFQNNIIEDDVQLGMNVQYFVNEGGDLSDTENKEKLIDSVKNFLGDNTIPDEDVDLLITLAASSDGKSDTLSDTDSKNLMLLLFGLKEDLNAPDSEVDNIPEYLTKLQYEANTTSDTPWNKLDENKRESLTQEFIKSPKTPEEAQKYIEAMEKEMSVFTNLVNSASEGVQNLADSITSIVGTLSDTRKKGVQGGTE